MHRLLANSGDGAFAVDPSQTIVLWNPAATTVLGHRPEDVLGKKCYRVLRRGRSDSCLICRPDCDLIRAARRLKPVTALTVAARTSQGKRAWLNLSSVAVPSRKGTLDTLIHLFRDVTRDHRLQQIAREFVGVVSALSGKTHLPSPIKRRPPARNGDLTPRQRQILRLLSAGDNTAAIASRLCISPRTVGNHVSAILDRMGVHSRLEAVTYSIRNGLI